MTNKMTYHPSAMSQIRHELCIPLTGILGMAHFLSETPLTSDQKEYLQIIQVSANRLLDLENKLQTLLEENK